MFTECGRETELLGWMTIGARKVAGQGFDVQGFMGEGGAESGANGASDPWQSLRSWPSCDWNISIP